MQYEVQINIAITTKVVEKYYVLINFLHKLFIIISVFPGWEHFITKNSENPHERYSNLVIAQGSWLGVTCKVECKVQDFAVQSVAQIKLMA